MIPVVAVSPLSLSPHGLHSVFCFNSFYFAVPVIDQDTLLSLEAGRKSLLAMEVNLLYREGNRAGRINFRNLRCRGAPVDSLIIASHSNPDSPITPSSTLTNSFLFKPPLIRTRFTILHRYTLPRNRSKQIQPRLILSDSFERSFLFLFFFSFHRRRLASVSVLPPPCDRLPVILTAALIDRPRPKKGGEWREKSKREVVLS